MPDFSIVIERIREDIDRGTDFDARIKRAVEDAIHYYRAVRFGFNTKRKTFTVSSEYTSLTANWIEVDYINVDINDSTRDELTERNVRWVNESNLDPNYSGEPQFFAIENRQLRVSPPPDETYSVHMQYLYDLQDVSVSASDGASNAWTSEGEKLIRMHAVVDLLENYIGGPEAMEDAVRFRARETDELKQLKGRANREQGAGKVEPFL